MSIETIASEFVSNFYKTGSSVPSSVNPDGVFNHSLLGRVTIREAFDLAHGHFRTTCSDLSHKVDSVMVGKDSKMVVVLATASGSFTGDWDSIKGNGKHWSIPVVWTLHMEGERIVGVDQVCDHLSINQQLGVELFQTKSVEGLKSLATGGPSMFAPKLVASGGAGATAAVDHSVSSAPRP